MTLIPITEKTQICFVHCGKEVCKCNPSKSIVDKLKENLKNKSKEEIQEIWDSGKHLDEVGIKAVDFFKDLDEDIKEIVDNNFDKLL